MPTVYVSSPVTVSETVKEPVFENDIETVRPEPLVPSPKFHAQDAAFVSVAVNVMGTFACPSYGR